jgi:hypothetical protein
MIYKRVKSQVVVNIDRFSNRFEFRLTLPATENLAETFVSHAVATSAFWAVQ